MTVLLKSKLHFFHRIIFTEVHRYNVSRQSNFSKSHIGVNIKTSKTELQSLRIMKSSDTVLSIYYLKVLKQAAQPVVFT